MSGEGQGFGRFASNFATFRGSTVFGRQDRGRAQFDCERFPLCQPFSRPLVGIVCCPARYRSHAAGSCPSQFGAPQVHILGGCLGPFCSFAFWAGPFWVYRYLAFG